MVVTLKKIMVARMMNFADVSFQKLKVVEGVLSSSSEENFLSYFQLRKLDLYSKQRMVEPVKLNNLNLVLED